MLECCVHPFCEYAKPLEGCCELRELPLIAAGAQGERSKWAGVLHTGELAGHLPFPDLLSFLCASIQFFTLDFDTGQKLTDQVSGGMTCGKPLC